MVSSAWRIWATGSVHHSLLQLHAVAKKSSRWITISEGLLFSKFLKTFIAIKTVQSDFYN